MKLLFLSICTLINYLSRGLRSFACISHSLFVFGHSLADNDDHILNLIPKGKISKLFVGIYGDFESDENKAIVAKANAFTQKRKSERNPLEVFFFASNTVSVWR